VSSQGDAPRDARIHGDSDMKTEITIRFNDAETRIRFAESMLTVSEFQALNGVIGGFYFTTERDPFSFMAFIAEQGFDISDFENIEFKAA